MSEVLTSRILARLTQIFDTNNREDLTLYEIAYELLNAALPLTVEVEWDEPIWWEMIYAHPEVCQNCHCADCGCCPGCGQADADILGCRWGSTPLCWCAMMATVESGTNDR